MQNIYIIFSNFGVKCDGSNYTSHFFAFFNSWKQFVDIELQKLYENDSILFYSLTWNLTCIYNYLLQVNLRYGVVNPLSRTGTESDTCTACAGTMILEFAALSRLSGDTIFEVNIQHVFLFLPITDQDKTARSVCLKVVQPASMKEHARKAMDVLWEKRQRGSDLVGTVINIHNGDWVRRGKAPSFVVTSFTQ